MRKVGYYEVVDDNRDKGRLYKLTEMSATQAELWATRAFLGMARSGIDIPDNIRDMGMAGLAKFSLSTITQLGFDEARILMDEMMQCVSFVPNPGKREFSRGLTEEDIDEVSTRLKLRMEVLKLHMDFSKLGAFSRPASEATTPTTS